MATDIFAKLGDIKGESVDDKHKDEIEVLSYSWGLTNSATAAGGSGAGAGKASFHDITFVHAIDKASPSLMLACATGQHLKDGTITHRKPGKSELDYLVIKMSDVIVTGVSFNDPSGGPSSESVSIAFTKVDFAYSPQRPDGSLDTPVHFIFDLKLNKAG